MLAPPRITVGILDLGERKKYLLKLNPEYQLDFWQMIVSLGLGLGLGLKLSAPEVKYIVPGIKIFRYIVPLASTFKSSDDAIVRTCL